MVLVHPGGGEARQKPSRQRGVLANLPCTISLARHRLTPAETGPALRALCEWTSVDAPAAASTPETWPRWRRQSDGVLVRDGRHSRRNPGAHGGFSPDDAWEVSTALPRLIYE